MAVFSEESVYDQQLDWTVLRDGGVALYWRTEILGDDLRWLESRGYRVVSFDTAEWRSIDQMHDSLQASLLFPGYYGRNLNALDECVSEDLVVPDTGGLVLVLNHYDQFTKAVQGGDVAEKSTAEVVLDIFARASRYHMLFGKRLLILVQSDDPKIQFGLLGGISASWNRPEWLSKNRGL